MKSTIIYQPHTTLFLSLTENKYISCYFRHVLHVPGDCVITGGLPAAGDVVDNHLCPPVID